MYFDSNADSDSDSDGVYECRYCGASESLTGRPFYHENQIAQHERDCSSVFPCRHCGATESKSGLYFLREEHRDSHEANCPENKSRFKASLESVPQRNRKRDEETCNVYPCRRCGATESKQGKVFLTEKHRNSHEHNCDGEDHHDPQDSHQHSTNARDRDHQPMDPRERDQHQHNCDNEEHYHHQRQHHQHHHFHHYHQHHYQQLQPVVIPVVEVYGFVCQPHHHCGCNCEAYQRMDPRDRHQQFMDPRDRYQSHHHHHPQQQPQQQQQQQKPSTREPHSQPPHQPAVPPPPHTQEPTSPPEEFVCPICADLMQEPMQCREGHSLCKTCWDACLSQRVPGSRHVCPIDNRTHVNRSHLVPNRSLASLIESYVKKQGRGAERSSADATQQAAPDRSGLGGRGGGKGRGGRRGSRSIAE